MTDLTVLVSPVPLYPAMKKGFTFGRRSPVSHPVMVTLETEIEPEETGADKNDSGFSSASRVIDSGLLSPPPNTWTSRRPRPRHRPTRSQSAPPERTSFIQFQQSVNQRPDPPSYLGIDLLHPDTAPLPQQSRLSSAPSPFIPTTQGGELIRPPPPLLRPTTFWRNNRRSGVAAPSYSPSSHLIRRSTFIAAGLTLDSPVHDLSAFCVESRIGYIVVPPEPEPELQ